MADDAAGAVRLFQGADVSPDGAVTILRWLDQPAVKADCG